MADTTAFERIQRQKFNSMKELTAFINTPLTYLKDGVMVLEYPNSARLMASAHEFNLTLAPGGKTEFPLEFKTDNGTIFMLEKIFWVSTLGFRFKIFQASQSKYLSETMLNSLAINEKAAQDTTGGGYYKLPVMENLNGGSSVSIYIEDLRDSDDTNTTDNDITFIVTGAKIFNS